MSQDISIRKTVTLQKIFIEEHVEKANEHIPITCRATWNDGDLVTVVIVVDGNPFNGIALPKQAIHRFYELIDELKVLTNNPPVDCEPV